MNRTRTLSLRAHMGTLPWMSVAVTVACVIHLSACAHEPPALDITLASSNNDFTLESLMQHTDRILMYVDMMEASPLLPYPPIAACGGGEGRACPGAREGDQPTILIDNSRDYEDAGHEFTAVFTSFVDALATIRLEQGGLPDTGLRLGVIGEVGSRRSFYGFVRRLPPFTSPATVVPVALAPDDKAFPPYITQITPQNGDMLDCAFQNIVIEFSRRVRWDDARAAISIQQSVGGEMRDVDFKAPEPLNAGRYARSITLTTADFGLAFFDRSGGDGTGLSYQISVGTGFTGQNGDVLDQDMALAGSQPFSTRVILVCEEAITPTGGRPCGSGEATEECNLNGPFECIDGRCVRTSCEGVECGEGEVCSQAAFQCEPDCRELGGTISCSSGELCDEGGFCRPGAPVTPPPGGSTTS